MLTDIQIPELTPRKPFWAKETVQLLLELDAHSTAEMIARRNGISIRGGTVRKATHRAKLF
jgi:hypothetical protein